MRELSFLPQGPGPVEVGGLSGPRRLLVDLRDLLVDGPGECDPVRVEGESAPGLLLNPTAAVASAALRAAMSAADEVGAVLVVHIVAHGSGFQRDPGSPVRHLLHAWDTVEHPVGTEPESGGWDPYGDIDRRLDFCAGVGGLVLVVDACAASWAKAGVEAWSGVRGGLLSAVLAASGDEAAWDACLTRTVMAVLGSGLAAGDHHRRVLVAELLALDIEPVAARRCGHQTPRVGGFQSHNPVLFLGRNKAADELARGLGLDGATAAVVLRLTRHWVDTAVAPVVDALTGSRVVAIVGEAGTGKSTLAAALRSPPEGSEVPFGVVHAAAFASAALGVNEIAGALRAQLGAVPGFEGAAARFRRDSTARWDSLDVWEREVTGPLGLFRQPLRLLVDGLDQLDGTVHEAPLRRALATLLDAAPHVSVVVTSRDDPRLEGAAIVEMPPLDGDAARRYLSFRGVDAADWDRLVALAGGRWLLLDLAADLAATRGAASLGGLYDKLIGRARLRAGELVAPVLHLLAAAGPGPVVPIDVLHAGLGALGLSGAGQVERSALYRVLGDEDLYRVLVRTRPGTSGDHVGLFHQTLVDHLAAGRDLGSAHRAVAQGVETLAPVSGHDPKSFRDDPVLMYAFGAQPRHWWEAGEAELVVSSLAGRPDVVPSVNLVRWASWTPRLLGRLGADHPDTLTARYNVAYWSGQAGHARRALQLFEAVLPDLTRVLGADHPDTLSTRGNLAGWTGQAGDARGALELDEALLPDVTRVLGNDHPDTLRTRSNVASWTGEAGDARGALELFEALLPDVTRVLGADHPDTLAARSNVASWTGRVGDARGALQLFEALLPDVTRVLGADHPDTLRTRGNLAAWTGRVGDARGALKLDEGLLRDRTRVLGADHPDTLTTRHNIASWTGRVGDARGALELFEALLPDVTRVLGADHPDTLKTRGNVAACTGEAGDARGALELFEALLRDQTRVLGADHPDTLAAREALLIERLHHRSA
jgi:hypothetical protein